MSLEMLKLKNLSKTFALSFGLVSSVIVQAKPCGVSGCKESAKKGEAYCKKHQDIHNFFIRSTYEKDDNAYSEGLIQKFLSKLNKHIDQKKLLKQKEYLKAVPLKDFEYEFDEPDKSTKNSLTNEEVINNIESRKDLKDILFLFNDALEGIYCIEICDHCGVSGCKESAKKGKEYCPYHQKLYKDILNSVYSNDACYDKGKGEKFFKALCTFVSNHDRKKKTKWLEENECLEMVPLTGYNSCEKDIDPSSTLINNEVFKDIKSRKDLKDLIFIFNKEMPFVCYIDIYDYTKKNIQKELNEISTKIKEIYKDLSLEELDLITKRLTRRLKIDKSMCVTYNYSWVPKENDEIVSLHLSGEKDNDINEILKKIPYLTYGFQRSSYSIWRISSINSLENLKISQLRKLINKMTPNGLKLLLETIKIICENENENEDIVYGLNENFINNYATKNRTPEGIGLEESEKQDLFKRLINDLQAGHSQTVIEKLNKIGNGKFFINFSKDIEDVFSMKKLNTKRLSPLMLELFQNNVNRYIKDSDEGMFFIKLTWKEGNVKEEDIAEDIWAFGAIVYQIVSRNEIFAFSESLKTNPNVADCTITEEYPALSEEAKKFSEKVEASKQAQAESKAEEKALERVNAKEKAKAAIEEMIKEAKDAFSEVITAAKNKNGEKTKTGKKAKTVKKIKTVKEMTEIINNYFRYCNEKISSNDDDDYSNDDDDYSNNDDDYSNNDDDYSNNNDDYSNDDDDYSNNDDDYVQIKVSEGFIKDKLGILLRATDNRRKILLEENLSHDPKFIDDEFHFCRKQYDNKYTTNELFLSKALGVIYQYIYICTTLEDVKKARKEIISWAKNSLLGVSKCFYNEKTKKWVIKFNK